MKIAVIGASGTIGSRVVKELAARGHQVIGIARDPSNVPEVPGGTRVQGDVNNALVLSEKLHGADAVVSAISPPAGKEAEVSVQTESLLQAARRAGIRRVLIVGGAASLFVKPGVTLLASGHLPEPWVGIANAHHDLLDRLRSTDMAKDLDWTYFSPAGFIQPGERTGKFRLGKDDLVVDGQGQSRISAEDYAVALVDEMENPQHIRQRFTIGY